MKEKSLRNILIDHFQPPSSITGERRTSNWRIVQFFVIPGLCSSVLLLIHQSILPEQVPLVMTVFSVVAAVFAGLLGVTQGLVSTSVDGQQSGTSDRDIKQLRTRVRVLRDLFTTIAYTIIAVVFSMIPLVIMIAVSDNSVVYRICTFVVYFVSVSTCIAVIQILHDLYNLLEHVLRELESRLWVTFTPKDLEDDPEEDKPGSLR